MELLEVAPDDLLGVQCLTLKGKRHSYLIRLPMKQDVWTGHLDVLHDACGGSLHPSDAVQLLF